MFYPAGTTLAGMSRTGRDRTAGRRTRCRASAAWSFTAAGWPEARSRVIANPAAGAGNGVDEPRAWAVGPDLAAQVAEARWRAGQRPGAGGRSPTDGVNLMARVSLNRSRSHPTRAAPAAAAPALHAARRGDPRVCPGRGGWRAEAVAMAVGSVRATYPDGSSSRRGCACAVGTACLTRRRHPRSRPERPAHSQA